MVDKFRDDEERIRRFYEDIRDVADILFVKAKTTKGAKRMLRGMRAKWMSEANRYASCGDKEAWGMLMTWCNQTDNYWPGLFHCYADPRIPGTSNDIERLIKEMKQLERLLSRSPRPAARFILNAPTNALLTSHPELPGAAALARLGPDVLEQAEDRLRSERKRRGVGWRAIRNFKAAKASLLERWDDACKEADAHKSPPASGSSLS
jgi:hypothetical protein